MKSVVLSVTVADADAPRVKERILCALEREFFGKVTPDSDKPTLYDGYWYPFLNSLVRSNPGHPDDDLDIALELVKDFSVAVDGGAQVGRVANFLAGGFERVIAAEISTENFRCLSQNVRANVVPYLCCLGDGRSADYEPDKDPTSPVYHAVDGHSVEGKTIDELIGSSSCGFIKLDLQGYDMLALYGAAKTIGRCKPVLYFEHDEECYERYGIPADAPERFLIPLGYKMIKTQDKNQIWAAE